MSVIIMIGIGIWYYLKQSSKDVSRVLPDATVFFIDSNCSDTSKQSMTDCMQSAYEQSKNPEQVISTINHKFPEISEMKVQICQSDKICFYVDLSKPIFLWNEQFVICDNHVLVEKTKFMPAVLQDLITISGDKNSDHALLIIFVKNLPSIVVKNFSIEFKNDHELILVAKHRSDYSLVMCVDQKISDAKILEIEFIVDQHKQLKTKKKRYICDIRFKNQIIIR